MLSLDLICFMKNQILLSLSLSLSLSIYLSIYLSLSLAPLPSTLNLDSEYHYPNFQFLQLECKLYMGLLTRTKRFVYSLCTTQHEYRQRQDKRRALSSVYSSTLCTPMYYYVGTATCSKSYTKMIYFQHLLYPIQIFNQQITQNKVASAKANPDLKM